LRAVDECSVREAADALDIPEATVRSRFFRARAQLRQSLSAVADGAPGTCARRHHHDQAHSCSPAGADKSNRDEFRS